MNENLKLKRMSEYTITNKYSDEHSFDKKELEDKFSDWIEHIVNKYSDVNLDES
ncbi:hypothetical protein [Paenibacillus sp. 1781tsa1]|uniref:hypothetical protein n=1 Tax=Paenibacillus sp. 1781tsa1 TaxID=2953810 RepID=UPI00209D0DC8|nr:hypothetical protein [Paenibacillus sp. 1781tsa1]MCP1184899.1 hypothetical protein [Paenibacillus sp. 1781tsa1]